MNEALPSAGTIYRFATIPYTEFSPPDTEQYAAFKILAVGEYIVVAILAGIWVAPPSLEQASGAALLDRRRLAFTGRPAVFGVYPEWWTPSDLKEVCLLGHVFLTSDEKAEAARVLTRVPGSSYSTLIVANYEAEGEWRWMHDRHAVVA